MDNKLQILEIAILTRSSILGIPRSTYGLIMLQHFMQKKIILQEEILKLTGAYENVRDKHQCILEVYLKPSQIFMMVLFCKSVEHLPTIKLYSLCLIGI